MASWNGRGLIECATGQIIARDDDGRIDAWMSTTMEVCNGIGLLEGSSVRVAGLWGGGLIRSTTDEWSVQVTHVDWPDTQVLMDAGYWWRRAVIAAGLGRRVEDPGTGRKRYQGMRYHDLRHGYASALISAGCSVRAVQHALGHASAATTLNLYSHLWPGDEERIRQAVDSTFHNSVEDRLRTGATDG